MCDDGGRGSGDRVGEYIQVSVEHIAMIEEIRLLKKGREGAGD